MTCSSQGMLAYRYIALNLGHEILNIDLGGYYVYKMIDLVFQTFRSTFPSDYEIVKIEIAIKEKFPKCKLIKTFPSDGSVILHL